MKKVLITGPLGQDGIILTKLLQNTYELYGVCRLMTPIERIKNHMSNYNINLILSELSDIKYTENIIKTIKPDIIVNFAGETDVINPWENINKTFEQNFTIPNNLLSSIVKINPNIFYFQSSSSMMYSKSKDFIVNELTEPKPMFPYGISKLSAHLLLNEFRIKYNLKCCSGIFFNHESYYRNEKFISKKLSKLVSSILKGNPYKIKLHDLNYYRDISHSEDFMSAIKLIIDNTINDDYIFSSGISTNILDFSKKFFTMYNLNFDDYIEYTDSENYLNGYNIIGDNTKLKSLGWSPKYNIDSLINDMIENELK